MNIIALISALAGLFILIMVVIFGNKIKNRWLRYLAILIGVFAAMAVAGIIPSLLGDDNMSTAADVGSYMVVLGIFYTIMHAIIASKKHILIKILMVCCILFGGLVLIVVKSASHITEDKIYAIVSSTAPSTNAKVVFLKHIAKSKCEEWRIRTFKKVMAQCPDCKSNKNICTENIPEEYTPTFRKEKMEEPYIYIPDNYYPEVVLISNLPSETYNTLCENYKKSVSKDVLCIK